jgi:hypothetical protein
MDGLSAVNTSTRHTLVYGIPSSKPFAVKGSRLGTALKWVSALNGNDGGGSEVRIQGVQGAEQEG